MTATIFGADSAQTLEDFERTATAVALVLRERGVTAGARVLLKAGNSAGYVTTLFALMHVGASIVLVDHRELGEETTRICEVATVSLCIVDDDAVPPTGVTVSHIYELLAAAAGRNGEARARIRIDTWCGLPDGLIMWSSGSTGAPKGVVKTGARFIRNLERNAAHMGHRPDDVLLPLLPFNHQYGLSMVLIAWIVRCSLVIAPYRRVDRALRMAAQTGATVLDATPATYRTLHNIVSRRAELTAQLATVRMFCSGAAPLDPTLVDRYVDLTGHPLLDSYGSTELGNISFATPENPIGTGRSMAGIGVRIVDDEGTELGHSQVGEIVIDTPDLMEGYLDESGELRPEPRGWRPTGDLGHLDAAGNLFVDGRKLAVHRMGHTLYPEVIESRVAATGCSTKIIALPDERRGASLVFFVEDERSRSAAYWRERICAVLPVYEQPNRVVVLDRLPLNRNGKPDRHELTRRAAERSGASELGAPSELGASADQSTGEPTSIVA
ncbi:class I adenylate-forming enzyme family protein [Parafrankia elaeagni]|uniref:class I adenylate-forming enzyme family protein n=1 Tax=Parafrankia elaeagni TaxID=222534 RepID=UPI00036C13DB|nr:class I adenylate-forming enzyme family protein [Parafrankia elaeagni]